MGQVQAAGRVVASAIEDIPGGGRSENGSWNVGPCFGLAILGEELCWRFASIQSSTGSMLRGTGRRSDLLMEGAWVAAGSGRHDGLHGDMQLDAVHYIGYLRYLSMEYAQHLRSRLVFLEARRKWP